MITNSIFTNLSRSRRRRDNVNSQLMELQRLRRELYSKRIWVMPQTHDWWDNIRERYTNAEFYNYFRMNWDSFYWIVNKVENAIQTNDTKFRPAIRVDKKVAVAIYILATNSDYKTVGSLFGLGRSTVGKCFHDFIDAALRVIVPELIKWPTSLEQLMVKEKEFDKLWGFPMTIGAIDGCHVPFHPPKRYQSDYYNFKGWYSVNMLVISDAKYQCLYAKAGIPGRCSDVGAFMSTSIYQKAMNGTLFPSYSRYLNGVKIPFHLLGDGAFRLEAWMMKPFRKQSTEPEEILFNKR
jgi:hypothetical protein